MRKLGVQHVLTLVLTIVGPALGSRIRFPDEFIGSEHPGGEFMDKIDDEISRDKKSVGSEPILPCPGGQTFCEGDIEDYPSGIQVLDDVIAAKLVKNAIFDDKPRLPGDLLTRSSFVKEARACDNRKATVYPKKAVNIEGKYVFIVNDNQYRQAVEIEQCLGEGEECLNDSDAPAPSTVCRQKYATYRMYVINEEGEQVYDSFSLPSACLCHHKSDFAIRNSFRTPPDSPPLPVCPAAEKLAVNTPSPARPGPGKSAKPKPPRRKTVGGSSSSISFGDRKRRDVRGPALLRADCGSGSYCETVDEAEYPGDFVLRALSQNNDLNPEIFAQLFDSGCRTDVQARFLIDEEQLCYGVPKVIFPRTAKNLKDEWKYIVNIENYTQSVEIEECFNFDSFDSEEDTTTLTPGVLDDDSNVQFEKTVTEIKDRFGSCLYSGAVGNNPGLTSCQQLYTQHKLLALSSDGQLLVDSFKLPSACACFYKEDFVLEFRRNMGTKDGGEGGEMEEALDINLPEQVDEAIKFE